MKNKTLILLIVTILILIINIFVVFNIKSSETLVLSSKETFQVQDQYFSFNIPISFQGPEKSEKHKWIRQSYTLKNNCTFRFCKLTVSNYDFDKLCLQYFNFKNLSKNAAIMTTKQGMVFYKKIPMVENGIYVIRKTGKHISYVYFFSINDNLYWFDFFPKSSYISYKTLFDNILLTIDFTDGKGVSESFSKELKTTCIDSFFLFCQPIEILIFLPFIIFLFILFFIFIVSKKIGTSPTIETLAELNPIYTEDNVEIGTFLRNKKSFSSCFLALTSSQLILFKFKKPFLSIPLGTSEFCFEEKTGLFGKKYIQFILPDGNNYLKKRFYLNKQHKIKIYSKNTSALMSYLV